MRFHLSTLFWVIFVFAASMGLASGWGIPLAGVLGIPLALYWVVLLWFAAGRARKYGVGQAVAEVLSITVALAVVFPCLTPRIAASRQAARRSQCANNLKQIGLAFQNYRAQWKCFPPAVVCDVSGRPLHSWRTLVLPYLEQAALYDACDMRLPWNEGVNASVLTKKLDVYTCPSDIHGKDRTNVQTSYVAVVGPGTVWDPASKAPPNDTRIVAVEMANSGIAWAEPKDLSLAGLFTKTDEKDLPNTFPRSMHPGGFQALLADGSVHWFSETSPRVRLEASLTQGFRELDDFWGHQGAIERESESLWRQWRQRRFDDPARRAFCLTALAFVVWVGSVVGFGIHAFGVRRPKGDEAANPPAPPPEDDPPAVASRPEGAAGA